MLPLKLVETEWIERPNGPSDNSAGAVGETSSRVRSKILQVLHLLTQRMSQIIGIQCLNGHDYWPTKETIA